MTQHPAVVRWRTGSSRSKRSSVTKAGCFVLEHEATGRFYVAQAALVSDEVDNHLALLADGKHPCKLFNGLYSKDPLLLVFEYPEKNATKRERLINELMTSSIDYLCLNKETKRVRRKQKRPGGN